MRVNRRRVIWSAVALVAATGVAGVVAPFIDAGRLRKPLQVALEQTLGRPVEIREVRYQVFPRPGLSATDLVIPDEERFGLEPIAYVGEMQAAISFSSVLTGNLEISSVRLVEASVNLARNEEAGWNFARLLERMTAGVKRGGTPKVEMRGSRINFRSGTLKSPFFLNTVDMDLDSPQRPGAPVKWSFEASPARTDRAEQGFGRFSGSGRWQPQAGGEGRVEIEVELERSVIGEVLTLVTGRDLGVQGRMQSRARLEGPVRELKLRGTVELENVDRPWFFGLRGNQWALGYEGKVDLSGGTLELVSTQPKGKPGLPLGLKLGCTKLLTDPHWQASFSFEELPAAALLELGKRLGARAPEGLKVEGTVIGSIEYKQDEPLSGQVEVRQASLALGSAGPLTTESAKVTLSGTKIELEPAEVETPGGGKAQLAGRWQAENESLEFSLKTAGLKLDEIQGTVASLPNARPVPVISACRQGQVTGSLRYASGATGATPAPSSWSGEVELSEAVCTLDGWPSPLQVKSATAKLAPGGWSVRAAGAKWQDLTLGGELSQRAGAHRPLHVALSVDEVDGAALEQWLKPALGQRSLIDRTLRRRATLPAWLRGRHLEGELKIGRLTLGDETFASFATRLFWDRDALEMPEFSARWDAAAVSGRVALRLGGETPAVRVLGRVEGYEWKRGTVDAEFELKSTTLGGPFQPAVHATGQFAAHGLELGEATLRTLAGCVDYDGERTAQRLKLGCLDASWGGEALSGQGASSADGRLALELSGPHRTLRLNGTLSPLQLAPAGR